VVLALAVIAVGTEATLALGAGPPLLVSTSVSQVTTSSATLEGTINPAGKKTEYHFEYLDDVAYRANPEGNRFVGALRAPTPNKSIPTGEADVPISAPVSGLSIGTIYHLRLVAVHAAESAVVGPERIFATFPAPLGGLPDGRAYEQVSPVNKDGGDVTGTVLTAKASPIGDKVTFLSTFGVPGGVGAQELPLYLASRGSDWSTEGLLPPPSFGQTVRVAGWTPDFSQVFERALRFGEPGTTALLARPLRGVPITEVTPYTPKGEYAYAGASRDGSEAIFESPNKLTPAGIAGRSNLYAWQPATKVLSLVSVLNTKAATEAELAKGAFAGSYDWVKGETTESLGQGGSSRQYYTQDQHAITTDGSTIFTAAGSGQLYMRRNPIATQSALVEKGGKEICSEGTKACTIVLSESQRAKADVAGPRPAAFMAATPDGSKAFFTSAQKLTDDATTGPEPLEAEIGRAKIDGEGASVEKGFFKEAAAGMTAAGEYLYWANAKAGTIGRAKMNGAGGATEVKDDFIVLPSIEVEAGKSVASKPQYVAVANGFIYWTDAADGADEHGVIGRAKLGASGPEEVKPRFIEGASNPQGIAVNASTIYWSNAGEQNITRGIGAAEADGGDINQGCVEFGSFNFIPQGLALDASHLYWTMSLEFAQNSYSDYLEREDLGCEGKNLISRSVESDHRVRGIALDPDHIYWAEEGTGKIGRADLELSPGSIEADLEGGLPAFISPGGALKGVAVDGEHIYWSANGETAPNPGDDLYRYDLARYGSDEAALRDLTVDQKDPDGAEVKGVLGVSKDGSRAYFAANGDLDGDGPALPGDCRGALGLEGECNLYRWEENGTAAGKTTLIARLETSGAGSGSDATNWLGSSIGVFIGDRNVRKTSWLSSDGETLLFRSQTRLGEYDNHETAELYRYQAGEGIHCVTCNPSGAAPSGPPSLGTINPSALVPPKSTAVSSRNFAAGGSRIFFESTDALVPADTNGEGACSSVGSSTQAFPRCLDVYEWEAAGTGSCSEGGEAFSPLNGGCIYLLSTGKSDWASIFLDASESGNDAFFYTREGLVGQDKDELLDVYDARVDGGIPSQNTAPAQDCESSEACHGPVPAPPVGDSAGSGSFVGPPNPKPKPKPRHKRRKHKGKKHHHGHAKRGASR